MDRARPTVLHITPHLGGGVGTVLLSWLEQDRAYNHMIVTLDYANEHAKTVLREAGVALYDQPESDLLLDLANNADIVLVHFWNHPLLYRLLVNNELPPCRLLFWAHVSGLVPPNIITDEVFDYPDSFILTTPVSRACRTASLAPFIMSTGGGRYSVKPLRHADFVVGYVGTVDFAKMHPDYIAVSSRIKADRFLIVGGNNEVRVAQGADSRFVFTGQVADVRPYLRQMDVFGYLLNRSHFGTCEQVLQEAMAAGVPPVVLDNPCECSLVRDMETGLIVHNLDEYVNAVERLRVDSELRRSISEGARLYASKHFSLQHMIDEWHKVFRQIMSQPKRVHKWPDPASALSSLDIFYASIGREAADVFRHGSRADICRLLLRPEWQSASKGTPRQYFTFLGGEQLAGICSLYGDINS